MLRKNDTNIVQKCNEGKGLLAPRKVIGIPSGITSVELEQLEKSGWQG